jgi:hypothetical protein
MSIASTVGPSIMHPKNMILCGTFYNVGVYTVYPAGVYTVYTNVYCEPDSTQCCLAKVYSLA